MGYRNVLVAVALSPDSQRLVNKAVSIVRPYDGRISLITLTTEPEMYSSYAAPMLGDLRSVLQEEAQLFMEELAVNSDYPIEKRSVVHGEFADSLAYFCRQHHIDLVICGNHSASLMNKFSCSAARLINTSTVDVLIVPL
ncbi:MULTISPECIES: universal stress protein UspC [Yersinia]|uniref:universal stress protein UspC n=1 Tax=Yersinia TaxID=629 RepID=UPI0005E0BA03|nr:MULTISPECIES: universal stress protein UspC [Yersinia]OVZ95871.1 universal stress protein UspC [Yersinia frederiksenii]RXA97597.1 universal stress protein UspC [Yersinia sp. 2105 StPb PI]CNI30829.1 universal stress protein UspC [Yersinia frederiksenii]CNI98506.1 universal stress protein UspC [Yersinia frederiksenii]CNK26316.1 universal stress protein UspC [Yersinia frederiksenii]